MDYVNKLMDKHFTPMVTEDKRGIKVIFKCDIPIEDGVVWFERAKTGWLKKPIKQNHFIIVDAEMSGLLSFLNSYYNLNEDNYGEVRRMIIDRSIQVVNDYFNTNDE